MKKGKGNKDYLYGEPGSILATASPAERAKIQRARAKYSDDQYALEQWARAGFSSDAHDDERSLPSDYYAIYDDPAPRRALGGEEDEG